MLHIRKNDQVMVIAGKDKGKTGRVIRIFPQANRALVENINLVKKAKRRTQQDQQGGLVDIEMSIHLSNLMLIDKKTNKPTRYGASLGKDGLKLRVSKKSNEVI
jgi:large subunit ribosomal protein L24